jgi:hypothetical protein
VATSYEEVTQNADVQQLFVIHDSLPLTIGTDFVATALKLFDQTFRYPSAFRAAADAHVALTKAKTNFNASF